MGCPGVHVIPLGHDNAIIAERVVAVVQPLANPVRRLNERGDPKIVIVVFDGGDDVPVAVLNPTPARRH